ncbi:MAG: GNAT family N-acetyltransferase [SAR202 cluster bacterium]|nr:GNAT family N-acetyltransferase [SAR202 cluster bacterium]
MPSNNFQIRLATSDDVPSILAFIKGLAEFEYLTNEVTVTEADLQKSLFGQNPAAEVVMGFEGDEPAGFAVFFHNYSTFLGQRGMYLEDIFVTPEHRRKGLGKMLLVHVANIAVERECGRFEWSVLDWNEDAARFYKELGAEVMSDWRTFRMQGVALRRLAKSIQS